jgi:hypothetical protein
MIAAMNPVQLSDIEAALQSSWGPDTCAPEDVSAWHPGNTSRGQCGVTAYVINDLLGGELVCGELRVGGELVDYHWWNRLPHGLEVDLTRGQFGSDEIVTGGEVIARPPGPPGRCREQYELLRERVISKLGLLECATDALGVAIIPAGPRVGARADIPSCAGKINHEVPLGSGRYCEPGDHL